MPRITSLAELANLAYGDKWPVVDVSDTTHAATGTTKWATLQSLTASGRVYLPEMYGAVGDGAQENAEQDTAAVQAAIDAAGTAGGGTVALTKTYALSNGGDTGIGTYQNIRYALKVPYNNVRIVGPGTLKLNVMPALTQGVHRWITVLFNRTGPLAQNPGDGGDWIENVGISGVRFDNSGITYEDRATMTMGLASSVNFAHARSFWCLDNTVIGGFGEGTLHCILGSREGRYIGNKVIGTPGNGMWLDGLRGSVIAQNTIVGEMWDYTERVAGAGIVTAANGDNQTNATHNVVHGNVLINCRTAALSLVGADQIVSNNVCWFNQGGVTGLNVMYNDNSSGEWPSTRTVIRDNLLYHANNIGVGVGIKIQGKVASIYNGTPIEQDAIVITGNRVGAGWQQASVALGPYVTNSWVVNNFLASAVTEDATCSGNTITPNY